MLVWNSCGDGFLQSFFINLLTLALSPNGYYYKIIAMVIGIALIAIGWYRLCIAELGVGPYIAATHTPL